MISFVSIHVQRAEEMGTSISETRLAMPEQVTLKLGRGTGIYHTVLLLIWKCSIINTLKDWIPKLNDCPWECKHKEGGDWNLWWGVVSNCSGHGKHRAPCFQEELGFRNNAKPPLIKVLTGGKWGLIKGMGTEECEPKEQRRGTDDTPHCALHCAW